MKMYLDQVEHHQLLFVLARKIVPMMLSHSSSAPLETAAILRRLQLSFDGLVQ